MRLPPPKTLLEFLDRTPPFLVYALAREPKLRRRPAYQVLVQRSGLKERTFFRIASAMTWESIPVEWVDKFCKACGVDPLRRSNVRNYLWHTQKYTRSFAHLSNPQFQRFVRQSETWAKLRNRNASIPAEALESPSPTASA